MSESQQRIIHNETTWQKNSMKNRKWAIQLASWIVTASFQTSIQPVCFQYDETTRGPNHTIHKPVFFHSALKLIHINRRWVYEPRHRRCRRWGMKFLTIFLVWCSLVSNVVFIMRVFWSEIAMIWRRRKPCKQARNSGTCGPARSFEPP